MFDQLVSGFSYRFCALVGPTAVGKTEFSLALAERMNCEIVCVDAMQVYQGLNVGTAKPTPEQRKRVAHHGLDLVSPSENYNASRFAQTVEPVLEDAYHRDRFLILCGGTGLYYRALLEGFFSAPDPDLSLRSRLEEQAKSDGNDRLYAELRRLDPETAAGIHPHDTRRIIRALEIIHQTGQTVTSFRSRQQTKPWLHHTIFLGFTREKEDLHRRIEERSLWMYRNGLIEETRSLLTLGCTEKNTALQALGYKECCAFLQGRRSWEEAVSQTIQATRQYAKRQLTWFRHQFPTHWIQIFSEKDFDKIVNQSLQLWAIGGNNKSSII